MATTEDRLLQALGGGEIATTDEDDTEKRLLQALGGGVGRQEPERGFLRTIVEETGRDIAGAAKVAGAAAFSPLELLGAEVPISFSDLTDRDLRGALLIGTIPLSVGVSGILARAGSIGAGAVARAATTAGGEAVAGAAFGLLKPLRRGENRFREVAEEAAIFGTFGGGASLMISATKATIGGFVSNIRRAQARTQIAESVGRLEQERFISEVAGFRLRNPETGRIANLFRNTADEVAVTFEGETRAATQTFGSFDEAAQRIAQEGFLEEVGPVRERFLEQVADMDAQTLHQISQRGSTGQVLDDLGAIQFRQYQTVREAAQNLVKEQGELGALAAEIAAPADQFGVPSFGSRSTRNQAAAAVGMSAEEAAQLTDPELLREVARRGALNPDVIKSGVDQNQFLRELVLNGRVPADATDEIFVSRIKDSFMARVLTPKRVASIHPEIQPLVREAITRIETFETRLRKAKSDSFHIFEGLDDAQKERVAQIIDESGKARPNETIIPDIETARQRAIQNARQAGDEQVAQAVEDVTGMLADYESRLVDAGLIENGIAGYFPIVNTNRWKLEITKGADQIEFQGFHQSEAAARRELERLQRVGEDVQGRIVPNSFVWPSDELAGEGGAAAFRRLRGKVGAASGPFRHRQLGIRDFSKPADEALDIYTATAERALAWHDFKDFARPIIEGISPAKSNLRVFANQYVADLIGEPRPQEKAFQRFMEWFSDTVTGGRLPVPPRALKKYTSTIRNWESFSRLGGFASGIVNLTQVATNTMAVLGPKWTARGFEILNPNRYRQRVGQMLDAGVEGIEHFVPLTQEGKPLLGEGILGAAKRGNYVQALHQMGLFVFNGAEKVNRVVTAWGAFNRELSQGASREAAAAAATEVVERTQFVYNMANIPQVLRSPVGATIGQFKTFVVNELEFIASLNRREAARFGASLWAMGGVGLLFNIPGGDLIDNAGKVFFDKKFSEALELSDFAEDTKIGTAISYGLPGIVFGVDVSDFVGVGSLRDFTRGLFGPAVDDLQSVANFVTEAAKDVAAGQPVSQDVMRSFVQQASPSAVRRAIRAQRILDTGEVRNPYSRKLIYRPDDRYMEAAAEFIGFPTITTQQQRAADEVASRIKQRWRRNRTARTREIALKFIDDKPTEARKLIRESNSLGFGIDQRAIRYQMRELQRPAPERRRRRTPAALREDLSDLFEATGSLDRTILQR